VGAAAWQHLLAGGRAAAGGAGCWGWPLAGGCGGWGVESYLPSGGGWCWWCSHLGVAVLVLPLKPVVGWMEIWGESGALLLLLLSARAVNDCCRRTVL